MTIVRYIKLPAAITEQVIKDEDGNLNIYLNCNAASNRQLEAYAHALGHDTRHDFEKECSVDEIELHAHEQH